MLQAAEMGLFDVAWRQFQADPARHGNLRRSVGGARGRWPTRPTSCWAPCSARSSNRPLPGHRGARADGEDFSNDNSQAQSGVTSSASRRKARWRGSSPMPRARASNASPSWRPTPPYGRSSLPPIKGIGGEVGRDDSHRSPSTTRRTSTSPSRYARWRMPIAQRLRRADDSEGGQKLPGLRRHAAGFRNSDGPCAPPQHGAMAGPATAAEPALAGSRVRRRPRRRGSRASRSAMPASMARPPDPRGASSMTR